uniref:Uncharacterized protein n=1 Tax=Anguilla anguilla TaxID=7936 RepID=A0A0E9V7B0_ANGAN
MVLHSRYTINVSTFRAKLRGRIPTILVTYFGR